MLYTTKEIAKMYGGEQKNVTPYMITHTWIPNGLKCVKRQRKRVFNKKRMGRRIFRKNVYPKTKATKQLKNKYKN